MNLYLKRKIQHSFLSTITLILAVFIFAQAGYAQSSRNKPQQKKHPFILTELFYDIKYIFQEVDFYAVVGAIGVSPGLFKSSFATEEPEFTEMWATEPADRFFEFGEILGSGAFQALASAACYTVGWLGDYSRLESLGSDLLRAHAINGIVTAGLKGAVNRSRPDGSAYSYPSGHTSSAFTSAGVIYYDLGPKWGIPAFVVASYIGLSRLQENKHYFSDLVAGAVLGTYVSFKITHRADGKNGFDIKPAMIGGSPGARLSLRF
jgi:membrane-associated phospholipid phosphatase